MSDALKQTRVEYGPWQRTKTIHYEYGAKMIAVESMAEDALRKQLAEAVGLLKEGFMPARSTAEVAEFHRVAEAFISRVGEVGT